MRSQDKTQAGLAAALLSVLGGLGLLAVLHRTGTYENAVFIALLFVPLVAYAVFAGIVSEITGPGGWGAKFRSAAQRAVEIDDEIEPMSVVEKADPAILERQIDRLAPRGAVAVQFVSGTGSSAPIYVAGAIYDYLNRLRRIDPQMIIVIVDNDKRFQASTDALSLERLTALDSLMDQFISNLRGEDFTAIRTLLPLTSRSVRRGDSNGVALRAMLDDQVETLVVVDEFSKPVGVVRRDRIVARLMAELAD